MHLTIDPPVLYFGTPVALISTLNADGSTNLTPISSVFALEWTYAVGLGVDSQAAANLLQRPWLVINLPDAALAPAIERIAPTTGATPVPDWKVPRYRHEPDKWTLGGLTPAPGHDNGPARVSECPVQIEAIAERTVPFTEATMVVHARVARVHAHEELVSADGRHIDLDRWRPLYYTFRHYFAQGDEVGVNFRAEV